MKLNKEYKEICKDILEDEHFLSLKNEIHHGSNRYDHCKRVARLSFILSSIFKGNKETATRAGLLHDFFVGNTKNNEEVSYLNHPKVSVENAKKYFELSKSEESIIETHMYHYALTKKLLPFIDKGPAVNAKDYKPTSKEGVVVCISDLSVSIFECIVFKARYITCVYLLFIFNWIRY